MQPFFCLRASGTGGLQDVAIMQQTLLAGQVQPSVLSNAGGAVKSTVLLAGIPQASESFSAGFGKTFRTLRKIFPHASDCRAWLGRRNVAFTSLCATEHGESFTNGEVLKAFAGLLAVLATIGVAGWLEGGAV